tara:strand:+ start:949 stop:2226 length:1278 start_codon:yes stop_codon:yes gene_type:complete
MTKSISFIINTAVNELNHIKLLLNSLQLNLDNKNHEILVFIDNDNQGTYKYLKSIKNSFYDLKIITHTLPPCIGYSRNNNLLVELAKYDIVSYLQSDMVISPHYDTDILKQIEPNTILSATRVEPPLHGESLTTITKDFGTDPLKFNLNEWNKYSLTIKKDNTLNYFFAPITFYRSVWLDLGGYDTLFRRSREDSDLVQRCLHKGIKLKQTFNAVVYHFTCTSSRGKDWFKKDNQKAQERVILQQQADQIELRRFIRKWGGFNHGESKLEKFDVDLKIINSKNLPIDFITSVEPLFSKVWIDDFEIIKNLIQLTSQEHNIANKLLNFTDPQWDKTQKYHNLTDYKNIFITDKNFNGTYNILISIDGLNFTNEGIQIFQNLHKIIKEYEVGNYEFNNIFISIKSKQLINNNIAKNPQFDKNLLKIE